MNQWKLNFVLLFVITALMTGTMFVVGTDILKDLKVKDAQINKLIDEVGKIEGGKEVEGFHAAALDKIIDGNTLIPAFANIVQPKNQATQNVYLIVGQHSKLTDTIMIGVVDSATKKITLISIPRDFWINGRKINEYYEFFGVKKLADELTEITNLSIDKYVIVDMRSFKKFIDDIGGIDINVEKSLYDYSYPAENNAYQIFSIDKGFHHLDGDTALKYARSRHSTTDFDRSQRQQEIIKSVKAELEKKGNLIQLVGNIYDSVKGNIETNISYVDAIMIFNTVRGYAVSTNHVFTTSDLLYSTSSTSGQYILLPKAKNYSEIQKTIQDWLKP